MVVVVVVVVWWCAGVRVCANKAQLHHAGLFPDGVVSCLTPPAPFERSK